MKRILSSRSAVLAVGLLFAAGCGSSLKLIPVSGKVTLDGQPLSGGQVTFAPLETSSTGEPDSKQPPAPVGTIDSSGNYKVYTNGKEGAPAGKYKAVVTPSMVPMGDSKGPPSVPFDKKYSSPKDSPLAIEVVEGAAPGAYDLKMTK
jgi:hypothetical protein